MDQTLTGKATIASAERILQHGDKPQEPCPPTAEEAQSIERVCVNCARWHIYYEGNWSAETPGSGFSMWCEKSLYNIVGSEIEGDENFRGLILKARTCEHFTPCTAATKEAIRNACRTTENT